MFTVDNKDTVIFSLDVILLPLLLTLLVSVTVSTLKQCFYIQLWTIYWDNCLQCLYCWLIAGNYMFKVDNTNTRTRCETYSKLTIDNFEHLNASGYRKLGYKNRVTGNKESWNYHLMELTHMKLTLYLIKMHFHSMKWTRKLLLKLAKTTSWLAKHLKTRNRSIK